MALRSAPVVYPAALFLSALLLLAIEPMFAKMVLPAGRRCRYRSVAMASSNRRCWAISAHLLGRAAMAGGLSTPALAIAATLPISTSASKPRHSKDSAAGIVCRLDRSAVRSLRRHRSAAKFRGEQDPQSANPYLLYAASNQFVRRIDNYPFVVEPLLTLRAQIQLCHWLPS